MSERYGLFYSVSLGLANYILIYRAVCITNEVLLIVCGWVAKELDV